MLDRVTFTYDTYIIICMFINMLVFMLKGILHGFLNFFRKHLYPELVSNIFRGNSNCGQATIRTVDMTQ